MAAPIPVIGAASTANVGQRILAPEERIMKKTVDLWKQTPGEHSCPSVIDCYLPEKQAVKYAIVIFPGGAYGWHAPHEGEGYAEFLNAHGISAFVCQYRVHPYHFPLPLIDARRAIRYVRFHAEEYGIDKRQIYKEFMTFTALSSKVCQIKALGVFSVTIRSGLSSSPSSAC